MRKVEYMESLGWIFAEYWINRAIYELGKDSNCSYALFEHQGEIGIVHNGKFDYYNLNEDDIKIFTEALNTKERILRNPDEYKVRELFDASEALDDVLSGFAIRKLKKDNGDDSSNK